MKASLLLQWILCTPVVFWSGWPFLVRAWASIRQRSANMFTLIALGVGASYLYSLVATVAPGVFPQGFQMAHGAIAVYFLIVRLDFARSPYAPGVDLVRWFLSGLALEATKWILVAGSAFAALIGLLMLLAPARLAAFEARVNQWHSSRRFLIADEKMHLPLEPHVEAHPGAAGWTIAAASLLVTLAMAGLLIARLH